MKNLHLIHVTAALVLTFLSISPHPATWAAEGGGLAPNPEFDSGSRAPTGWSLSGGAGAWIDRQILQVTGNGKDSSQWRSTAIPFQPGALYRVRVRARSLQGSGTATVGPGFANRDFRGLSPVWRSYDFVCRAPDGIAESYVRLGQWRHSGTVQYDAIHVAPVLAVHRRSGAIVLGEGESIRDGRYAFRATFGHRGSNYHRTLVHATAGFNTDRWVFTDQSDVVYRFAFPGHRLRAGKIAFAVNYHQRGGCVAEVRHGDEAGWRELVRRDDVGDAEAVLPTGLLPAGELFLRLRPTAAGSHFQLNRIEFEAALDGSPSELEGETLFARVGGRIPKLEIKRLMLDDVSAGGRRLRVALKNRAARTVDVTLGGKITHGEKTTPAPKRHKSIGPGAAADIDIALEARSPGRHEVVLRLANGDGESVRIAMDFTVPDYYRTDYGRRLAGIAADRPNSPGETVVWWCDATRKVPPHRMPPPATATSAVVELAAAKGDFEAAQVVVRPARKLKGLKASVTTLAGPGGATIEPADIQVLRVAYHLVRHPTDATGVRGLWPDALPPLSRPIDIPAGTNQPLWILVHVPRAAAPGDYVGSVALQADGWSADVPLRVHVWNFALPETNHIETAFGLSVGDIFRYHGARTEAAKREVLDLYFRSFSEHRISPYDPTPLDGIGVQFRPDAQPPGVELDFAAFDAAMSRAVKEFRFTNFRLRIQGMGGGTFHSRHAPRIGKFGAETDEYRSMFAAYLRGIEAHLRARGWLRMAYVYWFDEPDPKDYAFVRDGMRRLQRYAPGLRRMLTEEPSDDLAGAVDIWCPVSFNYDREAAARREAQGERFWWYVCTGPKAPYCTLFIDHPATELRVWLWQTWKRGIQGILVWRANYWTSSAAFPDRPQNPYEDPMGYVSGYSTPRGVKKFWGNGDGRFIYPPESAALPVRPGDAPVLEPPVSSIRWEMLREGIEDWEFLWLLRSLLEKEGRQKHGRLPAAELERMRKLLEVPATITADMTSFTTDPRPIYDHRAAVAAAIERLLKALRSS